MNKGHLAIYCKKKSVRVTVYGRCLVDSSWASLRKPTNRAHQPKPTLLHSRTINCYSMSADRNKSTSPRSCSEASRYKGLLNPRLITVGTLCTFLSSSFFLPKCHDGIFSFAALPGNGLYFEHKEKCFLCSDGIRSN